MRIGNFDVDAILIRFFERKEFFVFCVGHWCCMGLRLAKNTPTIAWLHTNARKNGQENGGNGKPMLFWNAFYPIRQEET